jgi:hypothetical protein
MMRPRNRLEQAAAEGVAMSCLVWFILGCGGAIFILLSTKKSKGRLLPGYLFLIALSFIGAILAGGGGGTNAFTLTLMSAALAIAIGSIGYRILRRRREGSKSGHVEKSTT